MPHKEIGIQTQDGRCPTHVFWPDGKGKGPWPGVIVYMDAVGMRPAMEEIAKRIADAGYYVLLPNLFYRVAFDASKGPAVFADPASRADLMNRVMPSASSANIARDTEAFLDYLERQPDVRSDAIGLTGYCMGGRLALQMAGMFGDRIRAAAAYHPGGVVTDALDSPHRLAPRMRARLYIGRAKEDSGFDNAALARLTEALDEAGVDHTIETYDARHGWVPSDMPVHDAAATEKHWRTLFELFGDTLQAQAAGAH